MGGGAQLRGEVAGEALRAARGVLAPDRNPGLLNVSVTNNARRGLVQGSRCLVWGRGWRSERKA